jgi:hypothetical protein
MVPGIETLGEGVTLLPLRARPGSFHLPLRGWCSPRRAPLFRAMSEQEIQRLVTRELVNKVREHVQRIYLDTRRLKPNTAEFDLMMECVREALSASLPFTPDKMEKVVDDAYGLYLNVRAVETHNRPG